MAACWRCRKEINRGPINRYWDTEAALGSVSMLTTRLSEVLRRKIGPLSPERAYERYVQSLEFEQVSCDCCGSEQFDLLCPITLYGVSCDIGSCHVCGHVYYRQQPTVETLERYYNAAKGYGWILRRNVGMPPPIEDAIGSRQLSAPAPPLNESPKARAIPLDQPADVKPVFDQYRVLNEFVFETVSQPMSAFRRILEVGSAYGWFLSRLIQAGHEAEGVELSQEAADAARRLGYRVYNLNIERALPDRQYDGVLAIEVVEHLKRPSQFFANCHEVLAPGGVLMVLAPNIYSLSRRVLGPRWYHIGFPDHLQFFTSNSLQRYAVRFGFEFAGMRTWLGHGNYSVECECARNQLQLQDAEIPRALNVLYEHLGLGPELTFLFRKPGRSPEGLQPIGSRADMACESLS